MFKMSYCKWISRNPRDNSEHFPSLVEVRASVVVFSIFYFNFLYYIPISFSLIMFDFENAISFFFFFFLTERVL